MNNEEQQNQIEQLTKDPKKYKNYLLKLMIENDASDMYLTYGEPPCLRIYDKIHRIDQLPVFDEQEISNIAYMLMDDLEGEKFRENLDIDLGVSYQDRRFRINISKQQKNIMIVIRLLESKVPTIDELGLPNVFKDLIKKKSGIILLAGPTGSGKSTTLASMIQEVNLQHSKHIITIEDPIEYVFKPEQSVVEQKQLGTDVLSYPRALKSALRQKPDVILFGEMRDLDSIQNAITLAETGHLVLSTIHSKSSGQTINKIIDSFSPAQQNQIRIQLSETLISIISQRLLIRKDGKGMTAAHEIMINNSAIMNLIRENNIKQINNVLQTSKGVGMQIMEESLLELAEKGKIKLDDALSNANDPNYITSEIKNRGLLV